jgi:hypothetical protein
MKGITMKTIVLLATIAMLALASRSAPITVITNYFAGYVCVTNGWATVGDSGLTPGTAYACIPFASLPAAAAPALVATGTNSDIRVLLYAINDAAYVTYENLATTNRPANALFTRSTTPVGTTAYRVLHGVSTKWYWPVGNAVLTP